MSATTPSPDASPDSGEAERLADQLDSLSSSHRPLLTAAANELRRLAASPASLSSAKPDAGDGGVERLREVLERQMEHEQEEYLPSNMARDRGLIWLEGWFDLRAALSGDRA